MGHTVIEVVQVTLIVALAVAVVAQRFAQRWPTLPESKPLEEQDLGPASIPSTPPFDAVRPDIEYVHTVEAERPGVSDVERAVLSSTAPLIITRDERVKMIRAVMARTDQGLTVVPDETPEHVVEHVLAFRRDFFDWLTESDDELSAEWEDCVFGAGRWQR